MDEPEPEPFLYLLQLAVPLFRDFDWSILFGLLIILLLLGVSALISGSEIAFFGLTQTQRDTLESTGGKSNDQVVRLLQRPRTLLATILIANNFVNVGIVILSAYVLHSVLNAEAYPFLAYIVEVFIITFFLLLLGEIMPKIYATRKPLVFARFMAKPLILLRYIFHPLSWAMVRSTGFIDRRIARRSYSISIDDLSEAINITSSEAEAGEEERKLLRGIVTFGDIEVKEIMKARIFVTAADIGISFSDILEMINDSGFSRIPIYEENFDNIRGVLVIKDLLPHLKKNDFDWKSILRPANFVPENKKIDDLMKDFQEKKFHMAIVVDEYGGTSGIITLEDILEEIVGEISDEYDQEGDEFQYMEIDDNTWEFDGKVPLNDFSKIFELAPDYFDIVKGESETLAGLLLELTGHIPVKDQVIEYEPFEFRVWSVDRRRIKRIRVLLDTDSEKDHE